MKALSKATLLFLLVTASLSSCTLFRSDVNSSNPLIAQQAIRTRDLQRAVDDQDRLVDTEKSKLKLLKAQLRTAKQELKARKQ